MKFSMKEMISLNNKRKKITVATTISAAGQIKAGGTNVVYGLYTRLSEIYDIDIIYIAPVYEKRRNVQITDHLCEYVIPKSKQTDLLIKKMERELGIATLYDVGLIYYLEKTPLYINTLINSIKESDLVMLDRPFLFPIVQMYANGRAILHRSQNIEYLYRKSTVPSNSKSLKMLDDLYQVEKNCCNSSDMNFSCSEVDLNLMNEMYGTSWEKLELLPNGVSCADNIFISKEKRKKLKTLFLKDECKIATFIGASHQPNVEACELIYRIAPFCKGTTFIVAGDICSKMEKYYRPENVILLGRISEKTRKLLFSISDVALNPMYSGSGTNVKMFDYMSMGLPIISSSFGTRGISDISGIRIANTENEFIETLNDFDLDQCEEELYKNRKLVEKEYDWESIVSKTSKTIEKFM